MMEQLCAKPLNLSYWEIKTVIVFTLYVYEPLRHTVFICETVRCTVGSRSLEIRFAVDFVKNELAVENLYYIVKKYVRKKF